MSPPFSADKPPAATCQNPNLWRFTWEAQSHTSTLRLLLCDSATNPSAQCKDLKVKLLHEQSLLVASFIKIEESSKETSIRVPVPRVLIDPESPVHLRAFEDHIEVKIDLLLPVDHPIVSDFDSILNLEEYKDERAVDSDLKKLSGMEEVHFYCRSCSNELTKGLRYFEEMPSVNWRDAADNWFGSCCCSFGAESEKLVTKYVKSYTCAAGVCLLNETSILLYKTDILGYEFPDTKATQLNSSTYNDSNTISPDRNVHTKEQESCCTNHSDEVQCTDNSRNFHLAELPDDQKVFLDGYLGNGFMVRSSGLSKDIQWNEFCCPKCSFLVGAYPCLKDNVPLDGGVRLFKCCISTCTPESRLNDIFRTYNLERMFSSQLLESAEDELSFRTIVRDMQKKSPVLQIVVLNPNSWCCSGICLQPTQQVDKLIMYPTVKVLFSVVDSRTPDDWVRNTECDEVYMFSSQIEALVLGLEVVNNISPPSCRSLQGLFLSSMKRSMCPILGDLFTKASANR